jgi:hypothetical protein
MVDVFDGQIELVFVVLAGPTVFRAAIGEDPQERNRTRGRGRHYHPDQDAGGCRRYRAKFMILAQ